MQCPTFFFKIQTGEVASFYHLYDHSFIRRKGNFTLIIMVTLGATSKVPTTFQPLHALP